MPAKKFHIPKYAQWLLGILAAVIILVLIAGPVASHFAKSKMEKLLSTVGGTVGDVSINFFLRELSAEDISILRPGDGKAISDSVNITSISVKGISITQLLFNKAVDVDELSIGPGTVQINLSSFEKKDSTAKNPEMSFNSIRISQLKIDALSSYITKDSSRICEGVINLNVSKITTRGNAPINELASYTIGRVEAHIKKTKAYESKGLYRFEVGSVRIDSEKELLKIDSFFLIPLYTKFRFARVAGKQTDRINAFIRMLTIDGFQYKSLSDSSIAAKKITITGGEVLAFRDKRRPFREIKKKLLPMELLHSMKTPVEIDTIVIDKTKITYEEFPEEGFESGKVLFQDLQALFTNISNRIYYNKPKEAVLKASARLMGKGKLEATFQLPIGGGNYRATGRLNGFALSHLNPVLENLAFISVESGRLNEMVFDFDYNDKVSNGTLTINYHDLKIKGLKKQMKGEKNDLKTLVINTIIKTDKDSKTPIEKRTGTISFERDQQRQIFNFWWKSLLSGIRSGVLGTKKASS